MKAKAFREIDNFNIQIESEINSIFHFGIFALIVQKHFTLECQFFASELLSQMDKLYRNGGIARTLAKIEFFFDEIMRYKTTYVA